jgi:hypothetical protein
LEVQPLQAEFPLKQIQPLDFSLALAPSSPFHASYQPLIYKNTKGHCQEIMFNKKTTLIAKTLGLQKIALKNNRPLEKLIQQRKLFNYK